MDTAGDSVSMGEQAPANGFAIPINTALSVARQIAAGQASSTVSIGYPPFIGIYIASGTSSNPQQQAEEQEQNGQGQGPSGGSSGSGGFGGQQQAPSCYQNQSDLQVPTQIAPVSSGTLVIGVICDSPAASSGMTSGSVITSVNGQAAGAPSNLSTLLAKLKTGETAQIGWVSPAGQQETSSIHLVAGPPQ
jgi:S1-C subfamily serine protease